MKQTMTIAAKFFNLFYSQVNDFKSPVHLSDKIKAATSEQISRIVNAEKQISTLDKAFAAIILTFLALFMVKASPVITITLCTASYFGLRQNMSKKQEEFKKEVNELLNITKLELNTPFSLDGSVYMVRQTENKSLLFKKL